MMIDTNSTNTYKTKLLCLFLVCITYCAVTSEASVSDVLAEVYERRNYDTLIDAINQHTLLSDIVEEDAISEFFSSLSFFVFIDCIVNYAFN